jgi:hypothetical protein
MYCPWWLFGMPCQSQSEGQPITTLICRVKIWRKKH